MTTPDHSPESGELSDTERKLIEATAAGKFLILRAGSIKLNTELHDPASGPLWTDQHTVRAEVLAGLLRGALKQTAGPPRHLMLRGARITGSLDLAGATLSCPMWLWDCQIEEPVNLNGATAPAIRMPGCHLPVLAAEQLRTSGDLILNEGFTVTRELMLRRARIDGQLVLSGASITSLDADLISVGNGMFCDEGFRARGEISLYGARIGAQLGFGSAQLTNPGGTALAAERLDVSGDLILTDGFKADGKVRLSSARIEGNLNLNGAHVTNPGGIALLAQRLTADTLLCGSGFTADGEVNLLGATIRGRLSLDGASLTSATGSALVASALTVGENMTCEQLRTKGDVLLIGAHIAGTLNLNGASLSSTGGHALFADMITVDMNMWCGEGFTADGEVRMPSVRIGGQLHFVGASLTNLSGEALCLEHAQVAILIMAPVQSLKGTVILTNAKAGTYFDDPASWPSAIKLRGFTYDQLEGLATVTERLNWLKRNVGGYAPQIYDQLAETYRRSGHEEAARKVAVAKQRQRRTALNPLGKLVSLVLDWTVGYGYRTWKAAVWLAVLVPLSAWAFTRIHMVPAVQHPAAFNSLGYGLDLLLPIADLGQKNDWQPAGNFLYLTWLLRGIGWILTTAVVAALTGVLKRD